MKISNKMSQQNIEEKEINIPLQFTQPSESTPAKLILVHISKMESFVCSLNPAASLYEDVTDEVSIRECFNNLKEYLKTKNIKLITVEDALLLKGKEDELIKLAKDSLNYERETKMEEIKKEEEDDGKRKRKASFDDYFLYSSDEYKEKVIKKFSRQNLLNIILTRPTMKLKHIQTDTYIESTAINFCPLGNLVFCSDQQITTKKGVVIGKSRTSQRKYEHIIMKQVFKNLGVNIIGEVKDGYLEGGDFFVAREDLSMCGLGLRTDAEGINYLMENDLLGTRYMAICYDEKDLDQQRMHLDTYFNILNNQNVVVIDFDEVSKKERKDVNRRVYYFDNDEKSNAIESDRVNIKNKIGEYKLIKIYDDFYKFLDDMGFNYIKISHEEQKQYMINFLNIGNNTVISVNKNLEDKVKDLGITVKYFDCQPILNMYGGMHCMTQVSRA
jgi:arginine deiminase